MSFWGPRPTQPSASVGRRYAPQLAIRSALRFFAALKNWVWPTATAAQRWAKKKAKLAVQQVSLCAIQLIRLNTKDFGIYKKLSVDI